MAYGLLTVLLGGGYAAVVLGLRQVLGRDSPLVVGPGATLAVAVLFGPARRRIQAAVDRRFNRRRHDTTETIAAFGDRLHQQIDLDTLTVELLAVVDQTMQPTQASMWLRQGSSNGLAAGVGPGTPTISRRPDASLAGAMRGGVDASRQPGSLRPGRARQWPRTAWEGCHHP